MDKVDASESAVQRSVTILNRQGLHARPVLQFVDIANSFRAAITVCKDNQKVDGKSPMEMMLLEATQGTELRLIASGEDAAGALDALAALIERRFDED